MSRMSALARIAHRPETRWQADGICAQTDPEAFFPPKGGSTAAAKAVCRECPVAGACLEFALEHEERYGVWGGKSERERRRILREREADKTAKDDTHTTMEVAA